MESAPQGSRAEADCGLGPGENLDTTPTRRASNVLLEEGAGQQECLSITEDGRAPPGR